MHYSPDDTVASYNYPGVEKPFRHQKTTADLLVNNPRFHVWNDIGTGKTFSVVWAMDMLMKSRDVTHTLVVAPLSTLDVVWRRTLWRVDQDLNVTVLKGTAEKRLRLFEDNLRREVSVSVINPDALHLLAEKATAHLKLIDLVIVDEAAMFRNPSSRRYKALKKIVKDKDTRFWALTGSPAPEAPTDVWSIARLVCPDRVPAHFSHLRDLTMQRISTFKWVARKDAEKIIGEMLKGYVVRFTRDECLDLPPVVRYTHEVTATEEQTRILKQLRAEALAEVNAGLVTGANEAVIRNKMLQVASGAVKAKDADGSDTLEKVDCSPKLQALDELLEATSQPVIIYAPFLAAIATVAEHCAARSLPFRIVVGDTPPADRLEAFDALQNAEIKVLIAHPRVMAHGITLTTSNVVVWWTPIDSHEVYDQACGRIERIGQSRKSLIAHFVSTALEKRVLKALQEKSKIQGLLLDYLESEEI